MQVLLVLPAKMFEIQIVFYFVCDFLSKFYLLNIAIGSCQVTSLSQGRIKLAIFKVFRAYLSEFSVGFFC